MIEHNGFWVVETFAGCGGSSEGWKAAGFRVAAAVEYDDHAVHTYRLNAPQTTVIHRDIREVTAEEILDEVERRTGRREVTVFSGSPPCQSWSMAGSRRLTDDENGELFSEWVGLVEELRPKVCVAENVEGLTFGLARVPLYRILKQVRDAGYSVHAKVLRAHRLGVPQTRHRLIILGFRDDLRLEASDWFPQPRPMTTIADALPHVARFVRVARPEATHAQWQEEESWAADRPGPTLLATGLGYSQWNEIRVETTDGDLRPPTVDELLGYSTFRPDFQIPGELQEQWARLGNSVPPLLMKAVAERVAAALAP